MNGESLNITQDNLDKLKTLFPDVFSEDKIDFEKFTVSMLSFIQHLSFACFKALILISKQESNI